MPPVQWTAPVASAPKTGSTGEGEYCFRGTTLPPLGETKQQLP